MSAMIIKIDAAERIVLPKHCASVFAYAPGRA
jgi:hypothetical protein